MCCGNRAKYGCFLTTVTFYYQMNSEGEFFEEKDNFENWFCHNNNLPRVSLSER